MECLKSKYIIQNIFSFMNEKIKFKITKYSKKLQNKLYLNINDFKKFSGKYIEYYEKGKGDEYLDNILIFEGEFLNGERKKGKEFSFPFIYEGEFKDGKRNGKGKECRLYTNIDGDNIINFIIFEGEYLNGERKKGREYNELNKKLIFEGEYLNGKRWNGHGQEYQDNHLIFEGEYKNGKKWNGKGYDLDNNIAYDLKEGNGLVKEYNKNGLLSFEGEYLNGEKNGRAKEYYERGDLAFEGEYKDGKNGMGKDMILKIM